KRKPFWTAEYIAHRNVGELRQPAELSSEPTRLGRVAGVETSKGFANGHGGTLEDGDGTGGQRDGKRADTLQQHRLPGQIEMGYVKIQCAGNALNKKIRANLSKQDRQRQRDQTKSQNLLEIHRRHLRRACP